MGISHLREILQSYFDINNQQFTMNEENSALPAGFREAFDDAREATVSMLVSASSGADNVLCGPLNRTGMSGWHFEFTDPSHSSLMQGDLEYGKAYLRHMINQGFHVSFAVWCAKEQALVCLKSWEPGDAEPVWPRSIKDAKVWRHKSP